MISWPVWPTSFLCPHRQKRGCEKSSTHFGAPRAFVLHGQSLEGGSAERNWTILTDHADFYATDIDAPDGRIVDFTIATVHN